MILFSYLQLPVIRMSHSSVPETEIAFQFNIYAMVHQTAPTATMRICDFAQQVSRLFVRFSTYTASNAIVWYWQGNTIGKVLAISCNDKIFLKCFKPKIRKLIQLHVPTYGIVILLLKREPIKNKVICVNPLCRGIRKGRDVWEGIEHLSELLMYLIPIMPGIFKIFKFEGSVGRKSGVRWV